MQPEELLKRYTAGNAELLRILTGHSRAVRDLALAIASGKGLAVDRRFVAEAAMLHDIGVGCCDAPGIACFGAKPYICHGVEGRRILEAEGLMRHALVCERHTGAGLTADYIRARELPLPHRDMLPVSLEEKLICYADKFFSKSKALDQKKPVEKIMAQMAQYGPDSLERFQALHALFGWH